MEVNIVYSLKWMNPINFKAFAFQKEREKVPLNTRVVCMI